MNPRLRTIAGRTALLLLSIVPIACVRVHPALDLQRVYDICAPEPCAEPVILVHGAFGSRLRSADGSRLWPRGMLDLLLGHYPDIGLEIDPDRLEPRQDGSGAYALLDHAGEADFYGRILDTLERAGRFRRGEVGVPQRPGGRVYYVFVYDWRRDLVESAAQLDEFIERIRGDFGNPSLRINLVAHSAGAILARYYLRYGGTDILDHPPYRPDMTGAGKLHTLVMVGAPNRGAVSGLHTMVRGYRVGLGTIAPELLATMPAGYQMLPHPDERWLVDAHGETVARDLYRPALWREQQWSIYDPEARRRIREQFDSDDAASRQLAILERYHERQLERAHRLHTALSVPLPPTDLRFFAIGGDCVATPRHLLMEQENGRERLRLQPREVSSPIPALEIERLMLTAGDDRVTKLSALGLLEPRAAGEAPAAAPFPLHYALFLCESHSQLTGNLHFQTNLLNILLHQPPFRDGTAP